MNRILYRINSYIPQFVKVFLVNAIRDLSAAFCVILGIFSLLSILSYSPNDPSLFLATDDTIHNLLGRHGATFADVILETLGWSSLIIPITFFMFGWELFRKYVSTLFILRLATLPLASLFMAGFLSALFDSNQNIGERIISFGGHLGSAISHSINYFFSSNIVLMNIITAILLGIFAVVLSVFVCGLYRNPFILSPEHDRFAILKKFNFLQRFVRLKSQPHLDEYDCYIDNDPDIVLNSPKKSKVSSLLKDTKSESNKASEKSNNIDKINQVLKKQNRSKSNDLFGEEYSLPSIDLLHPVPKKKRDPMLSNETLHHNAQMLESVLDDFGVKGEIRQWHPGPVVTLYELEPAPGIRSSRVIGLADDIARAMSALSARVAVIPGKNAIGIELPNTRRETVFLRETFEDESYKAGTQELALGLGKDIGGNTVVADLAKMPHLLIAGTTGSGKSVGINTMILSLLYKLRPEQCKMIMIDPKMLELSIYDGIPHLLSPVVTNPKKAVTALKWVVREMEDRYEMMSQVGVRKLSAFNKKVNEYKESGQVIMQKKVKGFDPATGQPVESEEPMPLETKPYIVVIVDEMADLMMVAGKEIEGAIQRLAQMARAAGIHLIMATQRPSVDVITGTIKANFPTRISFQVTSKIDSRTILGEQGAEQLLGQGDMLFMEAGGKIRRVHGAFVSDEEVEDIVTALKLQGSPQYIESITVDVDEEKPNVDVNNSDLDSMFQEALDVVRNDGKVSTSYIQRRLKIGYNRAARIIDEMEEQGFISSPDHTGKREILIGQKEYA
jgi:S-DNA-T family DNA segregation ATPase FtsK/SpoIIIE